MPTPRRAESGQASVELAAVLPLLAIALALCWQAILAGSALWEASGAAHAAARAAAVGADARRAALAALPASLERRARVSVGAPGEVTVRVHVPLGTLTAHAHFAPQS